MLRFPLEARLRDGQPVSLRLAGEESVGPLKELYRMVVEEGTSYPHDRFPNHEDFLDYWFSGKSTVAAYLSGETAGTGQLVGAFYLKPNWPGRARLVANAGFVVAPAWRRQGLGWLLGATMLRYARDLGYRSVVFNLVFAENEPARRLWRKLGFEDVGRLPSAVRKDDGTYQDAIIMWRSLLAPEA